MMMERSAVKAKLFRGLSDSTRLSILETLAGGEKTVGDIVKLAKQSQSNVSNHLKCLLDCSLVKNRKKGKNTLYSVRDNETKKLLKQSDKIISKVHTEIANCINYRD